MLKCFSYDIVCQEIPQEISLAVNISGCPNRCPGCHSPWLWEDEGREITTELLTAIIGQYSAAITCFCFMGGDADPSEIQRLSRWIRQEYPHLKTAWYSGRESIPECFDVKCMDYIKLGPYIESLGGLKSPTTNQALYQVLQDGSLKKCSLI
ncbi:MAG: anaerobic ribonucleoside-triphosphate reductase activating protein [Bacteroidales bacterium]|nr:anaerobic ribonucleoside-triphosphate reductase activating protein [Bacteroidales bacterium]